MVLSKKKYALLGYLLASKMPSIASSLLTMHEERENDFSKIPELYHNFCEIKNIDPLLYSGPLHKSEKVEIRKEFIAIILHIYDPQLYNQPIECLDIRPGLVRHLSDVTTQDKSRVSRMIREVVTMVKVYDDFNERVEELLTKMKD